MASDERLLNQGRLVETEQKAKSAALRIHWLKNQVRAMTDPHRDIKDLDTTALRIAVDDLAQVNMQYEGLLKLIAELREDLGLPRYEPR